MNESRQATTPKKKKPNGYWCKNKRNCIKEAGKYKSLNSFIKSSGPAYNSCLNNGWLDEVCSLMNWSKRTRWTLEGLKAEAKKYKTKTEFRETSSGAYCAALHHKIIDEICGHMIHKGNRFRRCIYSYEFPDNHIYVGLTYNIEDRHRRHMYEGPVKEYMNESGLVPLLKQLTDYISIKEARINERCWQNLYRENGWISLHKATPGALGSNTVKWTKEACATEAFKFNTRKDYMRQSSSSYNAAIRNQWLDEICTHMKRPLQHNSCAVYSIKDGIECIHYSITQAAITLSVNKTCIDSVLSGRQFTAGGYKFKRA